jgi:hypothetical protein
VGEPASILDRSWCRNLGLDGDRLRRGPRGVAVQVFNLEGTLLDV